jgi:hypothetical protein
MGKGASREKKPCDSTFCTSGVKGHEKKAYLNLSMVDSLNILRTNG